MCMALILGEGKVDFKTNNFHIKTCDLFLFYVTSLWDEDPAQVLRKALKTGELIQQLRKLSAPAEDWAQLTTISSFNFQEIQCLLSLFRFLHAHGAHTYPQVYKHTHKINT